MLRSEEGDGRAFSVRPTGEWQPEAWRNRAEAHRLLWVEQRKCVGGGGRDAPPEAGGLARPGEPSIHTASLGSHRWL